MSKFNLNAINFGHGLIIGACIIILIIVDTIATNIILSLFLSALAVVSSTFFIVRYFGNADAKKDYPELRNFILPILCFVALVTGIIDLIDYFDNKLLYADKKTLHLLRNVSIYLHTLWLIIVYLSPRTKYLV